MARCIQVYMIITLSKQISYRLYNYIHSVMKLDRSGHKGGWMKIADYDTSRDDYPKGWS